MGWRILTWMQMLGCQHKLGVNWKINLWVTTTRLTHEHFAPTLSNVFKTGHVQADEKVGLNGIRQLKRQLDTNPRWALLGWAFFFCHGADVLVSYSHDQCCLTCTAGWQKFCNITWSQPETLHKIIYNMRSDALGVISKPCGPSLGPIDCFSPVWYAENSSLMKSMSIFSTLPPTTDKDFLDDQA